MKIAFLARLDPENVNSWSGTLFRIYHKLKDKHQVIVIGSEVLKQLDMYSIGNLHSNKIIASDRYFNILLSLQEN